MVGNTPHPHAESMRLYAEDAAETNEPWLRWFYIDDHHPDCKNELDGHPNWLRHLRYSRWPKKVRVNGLLLNAPLSEEPEEGSDVYIVDLCNAPMCVAISYTACNGVCIASLKRGLMHTSKEDAVMHAKALLNIYQDENNYVRQG